MLAMLVGLTAFVPPVLAEVVTQAPPVVNNAEFHAQPVTDKNIIAHFQQIFPKAKLGIKTSPYPDTYWIKIIESTATKDSDYIVVYGNMHSKEYYLLGGALVKAQSPLKFYKGN